MNICDSPLTNYKKRKILLQTLTPKHTSPSVELFNIMPALCLSAYYQLFIRSVSVKSELPLTTLFNPSSGYTDESENKTFHS